MRSRTTIVLVVVWTILAQACGDVSTPKPRGYYRIDFPEKEYQLLDSAHYPYRFSYPTYGTLVEDDSKIAEDYWVNIDFPQYKARIHISYKDAHNRLDSLTEDSRTLAYKHALKAEAISEKFFEDHENRVYGMLYNLKGNTASSWQFYATDSANHFLRGALYFSVNPNKDSLSPAIDFFGKDVIHIMETLKWNQ
ncbi:MAG: gliding motility lipoprotein GldD [Tenuifilaceae bacterium]|jgi:gliding motility-associated lipoprotein GldD|nr:gliding motility lipoprotein GldD [Tenuifilaceae bacterium]